MFIFYNAIQLLLLVIFLPLIILKVAFTTKYRQRVWDRLGLRLPSMNRDRASGPRIWIHALSVGEVISSVPLVREMRRRFPEWVIIYSASTATGERTARRKLGDITDFIISFPVDIFWSVQRVIKKVKPDLFIIIETDLWPNLLSELSRRGIPILLLNGRISESSFKRYKTFSWFFRPMFSLINYFAMQSGEDEEKMIKLGMVRQRIRSIGNLKFDQEPVASCEEEMEQLRQTLHMLTKRRVFIAGSTHEGEEEIILSAYSKLLSAYPDLFLLVAPRDPGRADAVKKLAQSAGLNMHKKSELSLLAADRKVQAVVLDTLGELSKLYALATVAFVGGSLVPERGHNILEVAAHSKPVLFGPHMEDFKEAATAFMKNGSGFMVANEYDLATTLGRILSDPAFAHECGSKALQIIEESKGAVGRAVDLISKTIGEQAVMAGNYNERHK